MDSFVTSNNKNEQKPANLYYDCDMSQLFFMPLSEMLIGM